MKKMNTPMREHWDNVYTSKEVTKLGWYEEEPSHCIKLLDKCSINKNDLILDVGSGASNFIDYLIEKKFTNIVALDISGAALDRLKQRLGKEKTSLVKWIVEDITQPDNILKLDPVTLWHDRVLLHFLVEENQQQMYLSALKKIVKKEGYVIISAFSLLGAKKCSGLDIKNYDQNILSEFLGDEFNLLTYFDYLYHLPSGDPRPYIYTLFQRI